MATPHPLKRWRRAKSPWWSQRHLSIVTGVPYWAIARVETNRPVAPHHLFALASATGLYRELGVPRAARQRVPERASA